MKNSRILLTENIAEVCEIPEFANNVVDVGEKSWFAIYTRGNHEKKTNEYLLKKNVKTYLPLREVISQWKDRKKKLFLPLFPGYLFVNIYPGERFEILNTKGAVRILGDNGIPTPVPDEEIESTRKLLDTDLKYNHFPYDITGREVEVVRGPLQGISGKVIRMKGLCNLILSVHLIRRSLSVEIDFADVEVI